MSKALTVRAIEAFKGAGKRREIPDAALTGLFLVVQPSGAKSWAVRYRTAGRTRKLTLGRYPALGLADARSRGRDALSAAAMGTDPATEKQDRRAARDTVATLADEFLKRHAAKNRTAAETARIFTRDILPAWAARQVTDIARRDVIELLDSVTDRGSPVMANRVLAAVRKFFNWCVERDIIDRSPAAGVKPPAKEKARDRVLSDEELRLFWTATEKLGWPFGPLFRLLLLTGARRMEVAGMRWAEIDGDRWTIPAGRAKNGNPLTLKLTGPALAILNSLPRLASSDLIFTTTGIRPVSGFSKVHQRLCQLMQAETQTDIPRWTLHDLRRTAASGMARLGVQLPVIERVLNHVSGSFGGIVGVYQRHSYADEMADALERWAAFIVRLTTGGDVVPLRA